MRLKKLNSGVIYTKSSCIGCNKCISGCVALGANVVVKDESSDRYMVMVDPNKCILCGHCVEECVHNARTYRDDTDKLFAALERGEKISILVAPSLMTDFEKQYSNILGYLKHLGVRHVYNTGFGADIMVWVYMNFIHDFGLSGVISQFCPVIVNYLEKYKPELLNYLMPVQSPVICTAIYVSDYLKNGDKLAYISPCIAEKYEIDDVNTYGKVSYNVTFQRLMKRLAGMDLSGFSAEDEASFGLGALISSAGGLSNNIKPYIGFNKVLIQTSGYSNIFPYFDHYYKEVAESGELPFLVDVLSCTNGCDFGTGTSCGVELRNEVTFSAHRARERAYASGNVPKALNYEERLNLLNKHFEGFELSSFVRQYDNTRAVTAEVLSDAEIEEIYHSMYKNTRNEQHTDCGSCGYKTCRQMAYAIGTHVNHKENCINYSKQCNSRLLEEISAMNDELKKSDQLKSNFLANMSHEIRTPMNAVIGMAEMALRGDLPDEERGYIEQIKASGRSLLAIINDILDFSKIESGKMEINETDYTVMSLINDTVNIVTTRIGEKDITLVVDANPYIPFKLHGDDIRIKQVLVNFANNAVKFTESGYVRISMSYERSNDSEIQLTVSIRDSGIGIKKEDMDKLFTSFQQVDSKRNRNIEGTGLGLAISREFVRLMNGQIRVESTYGEGSTFSFTIPQRIVEDLPSVSIRSQGNIKTAAYVENLYVKKGFEAAIAEFPVENVFCSSFEEMKEAVENGAKFLFIDYPLWNGETDGFAMNLVDAQVVVIVDPRKDIVSAPYVRKLNQPVFSLSLASVLNYETEEDFGSRHKVEESRFEAPNAQILIVDDNGINLTVAKGLLSPMHMNISVATSAREAISMIERTHYDIVFMDHMMPDIDGVEATHMIRDMPGDYYQNLPIIALTANAINNAKEMFLQEGMSDFVAKPIEMLDITSKLKHWLPSEKIKALGKIEAVPLKQSLEEHLPEITGLDVSAGLALSGSLELYQRILSDYYGAIEKKAALIEQYAEKEMIGEYTIEVHALKSSSKLVGAMELSEMAARLEKAGHDKDLEPIRRDTAELLRRYRTYLEVLAPYGKQEAIVAENEISETELAEQLTALHDALEDFDIDTAGTLVGALKACKLDSAGNEMLNKLGEAVDAMEYDQASALAVQWKESL